MDDSSLQHIRFYEQLPNSWLHTTAPATCTWQLSYVSDKNALKVIWDRIAATLAIL
jgi:hypothetical protein